MRERNITGRKIREIRLSSRPRVTQAELAARLQVMGVPIDRVMLSKIEGGSRPVLDYEIQALARALKVSVTELFENKE